jgi:uncharacterized protein YciI
MPQFLYRIRPRRVGMLTEGPTPEEQRVVGEHFAYLDALCAAGIVLLAGRTLQPDDTTFGIVVLDAADAELAQQIMDRDPAVRGEVMWAEIFPFRVALASPKILGG